MKQKLILPDAKKFRMSIGAAAVALAGLFIHAPVMAQDAPSQPAVAQAAAADPERTALARQMLEAMDVQSMFRGTLSSLDSLVKTVPPKDQPRIQQLIASMTSAFDAITPELLGQAAEIYTQDLTTQEMQDTLAFYRTPSGQSVLKKTPEQMGQMFMMLNSGERPDMTKIDPGLLALAHQVLDATDAKSLLQSALAPQQLSPEDQKDLDAMMPDLLDMTAALYAQHLTQQEMQDTLTFYRTPSGQSIRHKMPALNAKMEPVTQRLMKKMFAATKTDYCAHRTCDDQDNAMFDAIQGGVGQ